MTDALGRHPDPDAHLARIGLNTRPPATLDGLASLQLAHMTHVPFENFDVRLGRPLDLSVEALFDKIVCRRRGGYCFELNTLYGALLDALGFERRFAMARVWYRAPDHTPAQTHVCHVVTIDGENGDGEDWVSDVGFGGRTSRVPLKLGGDAVKDAEGPVRLRPDAKHGWMLERSINDVWSPQFSFTGAPAFPADLLLGNHFVETHPSSHFRHGAYAGLFTEKGRVTMVDKTLATREGEATRSETIAFGPDWLVALHDRFGIALELSDADISRLQRS